MRNLKKFLALVLAMMMAMSLMITANAANEADNATNVYPDGDSVNPAFAEAVDVLSGMGVFKGRDNGNFDAGATITRAETAAIIYRLITADVNDTQTPLYRNVAHPFTDVTPNDWYAGYIGFLWNAGIIKGQSATKFNPYGQVTGYEALAMILRAVGYDQNHEFEGQNWVINVASISQQKDILADVDKANYGGPYLYAAARRDVVASLLFRTAAYVPQVIYTTAFSYTETGMTGGPISGTTNPTLGYANFGLTYAHGIVVGNQTTGENATKIGFSRNPQVNQTSAWVRDIDQYAYSYNSGTKTADGGGGANTYAKNVSLYFDWSTDLRLFNHAVRVWFDARGDGYSSKINTYALYDAAVATAVVTKSTTTLSDISVANMTALVDGTADRDNNWDDTKMVSGTNAHFNYAFAAMNAGNYDTNADVSHTAADNDASNTEKISAVSPVLENNGTTSHGLYLLISNHTYAGEKVLDVVISLDMTMSQIVQSNTTTKPLSVGVTNANGAHGTNEYFGVAHDDALLTTGAAGSTNTYVTLAQSNLVNSPKTTKGTKVAAIEITGTKNGVNTAVAPGADTFGKAGAVSPMTSTYYYQLTENTLKKTETVIKVDTANQDVYLSDGTVLHQSIFAEDTDETFIKNDVVGTTSGMEGFTNTSPITFRLIAGRDYTFTLDEQGHYIYWETPSDSSTFVYGTYIDWQTAVASSLFDYPMVYVNTDGEGKQQVNVTSVNGTGMGIALYDALTLPKRDQNGAAGGNNSGFVKGRYIGYALGSDGVLNAVTAGDSKDTGFLQGAAADFGAGSITINSRSVAVGAEAVSSMTKMFLTENTKFIIVDGAGTANQTVKVVDGISKLMEGCDSVVIDGQTAIPAANTAYLNDKTKNNLAVDDPYEMFYYKAGPFEYDQNYDPSANEIKTLFLPAACIKFNASSTTTLVFVGSKNATMINANNGNWASQFTVYRNGEGEDVWIEGDYTVAGNDANTVYTNPNNVFYNLIDSGKKATDGRVIYNIRPVADDAPILGQYWDDTNGDGVGDTVTTKPVGYDTLYKATTFNQQVAYIGGTSDSTDLYNVGNAGIKNLNAGAYPGIADNNLSSLNGASSLYNNTGVPVSCILSDSYVVSFIYVNA